MVGELLLLLPWQGFGEVAVATFVAMIAAHALGGARIVVIQAGVSAILTVMSADGEAGTHRLIDATIGGGVALFFSQIVFPPEPVALLRTAQADALQRMADGLSLAARALETNDAERADQALTSLRGVRDRLAELAPLRKASRNVARRSAVWRSQMKPLVRERENADHRDLLGSACVMLARTTFAVAPEERSKRASSVRELAGALDLLAGNPGDRETRQTAADIALLVARPRADAETPSDARSALADAVLRIVATDIMVFAGVDASEADAAIRLREGEVRVPTPPAAPRIPFGLDRWTERRTDRPSTGKLQNRPPDDPNRSPEE